jgi:hypothetical protein
MQDSKVYALKKYYKALVVMHKSELDVFIDAYDNPTVSDHANLIETMDSIVTKIADAEDKLRVLEDFYYE